jgi:hypothetical protein
MKRRVLPLAVNPFDGLENRDPQFRCGYVAGTIRGLQ